MNTSNSSPNNRCKRRYKNQGPECGGLLVVEKMDDMYCIRCINCSTYIFPPRKEDTNNLEVYSRDFTLSKVM